MKKTRKSILTIILCAILASTSLASCSEADDSMSTAETFKSPYQTEAQAPENTKETESATEAISESNNNTHQDISLDTYKEQISYYMGLTESLQADLLKLKEETYISECEYQLEIETLEQTVQNLKDIISVMSKNEIKNPAFEENSPANDQLAAKTDFRYQMQNNEVTITEYIGSDIDVKIPSTLNGYPVTRIGEGAFQSKIIRSVVIPSGVKEIDWFAFSGCTVLESVTVPSSVVSVQYGAFDLCPKSLIIKCNKNSYIEAYALSWGMKVEAK